MKLKKALRILERRIKAWEDTQRTCRGNAQAFKKPGSMSGRKS